MSLGPLGACLLLFCNLWSAHAFYVPLKEYSGKTFFDAWDYYGNVDNTTWGNVTYLDQPSAMTQKLTYVNEAGHAIIRVDNTTNVQLDNYQLAHRPSIRLTSKDTYGVGTLWIFDAIHMPYGCSVWPAFWSKGVDNWPHTGEIDIVEGINLAGHNQMALHADPGCVQAPNNGQTGQTIEGDCHQDKGCIVAETKPNSYGQGFAQAGGGVFALQMDVSGIYIWFWSRPDIPALIKNADSHTNMDTTLFGPPSASYPAAGCNITQYFQAQQLLLVTTLCGVWAGIPSIYSQTCPGTCVSNIIGPGSPNYDNAYWEINYLRTYIVDTLAPPSGSSSAPSSTAGSTTVVVTVTSTEGPAASPTINPVLSPPSGAIGLNRSFYLISSLLLLSAFLLLGN